MKLSCGILNLLITFAIAAPLRADTAGPDGHYYDVPLGVVWQLPYKPDNPPTSATGRLLTYHRADGTTAAQLIVTADAGGGRDYTLMRANAPDKLAEMFGSADTLRVAHSNRSLGDAEELIVDLLDDEGNPRGVELQFLSADGSPLNANQVEYFIETFPETEQPYSVAKVSPGGKMLFPHFDGPGQASSSHFRYRFKITDPVTGAAITVPAQIRRLRDDDNFTTIGIPFLNDGVTTDSGLNLYSGQIFNANGQPAGGMEFKVSVSYNQMPFQQNGGEIAMTTGPDGRFQLALKPDPNSRGDSGIVVRFDNSAGMDPPFRKIKPNKPAKIQPDKAVVIELVDENGRPVSFESVSNGQDNRHRSDVGMLYEVNQESGKSLVPLHLADPASYSILKPIKHYKLGLYIAGAKGIIFGKNRIDDDSTTVTFRAEPIPFSVIGTVIDESEQAVSAAYVVLWDNMTRFPRRYQDDQQGHLDLQKMWEETGGSFEKLGAYMAKTNADGNFQISGDYLLPSARVLALKPGEGLMTMVMLDPEASGLDNSVRLSGNHVVPPVTLNKRSTVTLTIDETSAPKTAGDAAGQRDQLVLPMITRKTAHPDARLTTATYTQSWATTASESNGQWTLPVPADTTFTLSLRKLGINMDSSMDFSTTITTPLAPGEIRDIGVLKSD